MALRTLPIQLDNCDRSEPAPAVLLWTRLPARHLFDEQSTTQSANERCAVQNSGRSASGLRSEGKDEMLILKRRLIVSAHRSLARVNAAPLVFIAVTLGAAVSGCGDTGSTSGRTEAAPTAAASVTEESTSPALVAEGQRVFRFETFGDEQVWTDKLRLNEVVEKTVDPTTALKVGLKVDADALPPGILDKVDLKSPATTVALLKMNAVVGIQATVDSNNHVTRLGITCALCHSTVDNSVMPGIGRRQDGWPNRDLNVGAIIALSPGTICRQKSGVRIVGSRQI